jgi:hypothetical protein
MRPAIRASSVSMLDLAFEGFSFETYFHFFSKKTNQRNLIYQIDADASCELIFSVHFQIF